MQGGSFHKEGIPYFLDCLYITNSGKKYHREGCQYLKKSKIPISLSSAQSQGYTPCSKCF